MIVLPPGLVSTRYPGYFWDIPNQKLYSIKTGILKEVIKKKAYRRHEPGWFVSYKGVRRKFTEKYVSSLKYPDKVEIYPKE